MTLVLARIESELNPLRYIVDNNGFLPMIDRTANKMSTHAAFEHLGRVTLGQMIDPLVVIEAGNDAILYKMKPVSDEAQPVSPYRWNEAIEEA